MNGDVQRRHRGDEGGAVLVEASVATVVVFTFIFLIFQSAFVARTYLAARDAANSGARVGSISADSSTADDDLLRAVDKSLSSTSRSAVVSVIVFKPQGKDMLLPEGCDTGGQDGLCNYYSGAAFLRVVGVHTTDQNLSAGSFWPSTSRITSTSDGIDRLGVQVTLNVGGIPGTFVETVTKTAVVTLEPHS